MIGLCALDLAIANAIRTNTLTVATCWSTWFQQEYVAISDATGLICVEMTQQDAEARVAKVANALGAEV